MKTVLVAACALMSCAGAAWTQPETSDARIYERFLRQVAQFVNVSDSGPVKLNGQPTDLKLPTVPETIGLTEAESRILNATASDCEASLRRFDLASQPLVFNTRLRIIADENAAYSNSAVQELNAITAKHDEIVLAQIERHRKAFGNSPFAMLDSWIRARKEADSFVPLIRSSN